jgi:hypothetical protein
MSREVMSEDEKHAALAVIVDGVALPADEARALWRRFSGWMEEHRGDLAGFAAREGYKSIHPAVECGRPVLRASHTEAQRPYTSAARATGDGGSGGRHGSRNDAPVREHHRARSDGGSGGRHGSRRRDRPHGRKTRK